MIFQLTVKCFNHLATQSTTDRQTGRQTDRQADRQADISEVRLMNKDWSNLLFVPGFINGGGGHHGDGVLRKESRKGKPIVIVVLFQVLQVYS